MLTEQDPVRGFHPMALPSRPPSLGVDPSTWMKVRQMKLPGRLGSVLLLIALGYLGSYVLAVLVAVHAYRLRRAMGELDRASHAELKREQHKYREERGF